MRLPVALNTVPQDLRQAVETGDFGAVLAATSVLDDAPVRAALHVWALAARAETGVYIDDVPADAGCAVLFWQVIQSDIPPSDDNDAFDGDLDRLVANADTLARQTGMALASEYLPQHPVTSGTVARQAAKLRGDDGGTVYHLAARLARREGIDDRELVARAALCFASVGLWDQCLPDLEAILADTAFCQSENGSPLAHEAAWALLGAAVTSGQKDDVTRHWQTATQCLTGFPRIAPNIVPLLQYALKTDASAIGRVVLATIDADQGKNRHFYESPAAQNVVTAARKAYRKRLFGLF